MMETTLQEALEAQGVRLPEKLLIRNLARDPESRTIRKLRPGNRLGFTLEDGTRIRRTGARAHELDQRSLLANLDRLAEGVELRYIEVTLPDGTVVAAEALRELAQRAAGAMTRVNSPAASLPQAAKSAEPKADPEGSADQTPLSDAESRSVRRIARGMADPPPNVGRPEADSDTGAADETGMTAEDAAAGAEGEAAFGRADTLPPVAPEGLSEDAEDEGAAPAGFEDLSTEAPVSFTEEELLALT